MKNKIFLIGLPGSGKTTLGQQLAARLNYPFIDLDKAIEQRAGLTIEAIFNNHGEPHFRAMETQELNMQISTQATFVMATGGGAPCFGDNILQMKNAGTVLFLDVPTRTIANRIQLETGKRPLLKYETPDSLKDRIEFLRSHRISFYRQAHITLSGDALTAQDAHERIKLEAIEKVSPK
jgi:shikimate kinase